MKDIIITSSVLILAILLIRQLTKGKISPLLQYMLWLLVALRLAFPIPLWNSSVSVMNLLQQEEQEGESQVQILSDQTEQLSGHPEGMSNQIDQTKDQPEGMQGRIQQSQVLSKDGFSWQWESKICLTVIWLAGVLLTGGYMLFYQIKWKKYLIENRMLLKGIDKYRGKLWVYTVDGLPSPCLSGRNIYLTEEMAADEKRLTHILAHEYCHYRHLDSLWVIVRCMLAAVYWFHPLVWAAAYVSKQDSELACDEAAICLLGEEERFAYGRTLIHLISEKSYDRSKMGIASTMSGGEKGIRERIRLIAGKQKHLLILAGLVVVLMAALAVITFSGAEQKQGQKREAFSEPVLQDEDVQKEALVFMEKLASVEDNFTDARKAADYMQAYYENGMEALEEGLYLLEKAGTDKEMVSIYGMYTKEYGCRGIKVLIGEDVTNYDLPWLVSGLYETDGNIRLYGLHESSGDGTIRTFAFQVPHINTSNSEVWRLYMGDCYDTGTVQLSEFAQDDYMAQIKERMNFKIAESENKVYVYDRGAMIGAIEIPESEHIMKKIKDVVYDGNVIRWELGYMEDEIRLTTAIGLKLENEEEIWYRGLNLISFPVSCGNFGNRTFQLGQAEIETDRVNPMFQETSVLYINPCPTYTRISNIFESRVHPITGETIMHEGVDLAAEEGADIVAAAEGEVYEVGFDTEKGYYVILYHEKNGTCTHYNNCKEILVTEGDYVECGQKIAMVGQTGMSTGPHLHFAVSINGEYIEPVISFG